MWHCFGLCVYIHSVVDVDLLGMKFFGPIVMTSNLSEMTVVRNMLTFLNDKKGF